MMRLDGYVNEDYGLISKNGSYVYGRIKNYSGKAQQKRKLQQGGNQVSENEAFSNDAG